MFGIDSTVFFWLFGMTGYSPVTDDVLVFLAVYLPIILASLAFLYVTLSTRGKREKLKTLLLALGAVILARGLITEGIRFLVPRERPFLTYHLHPLFLENAASFPSAHATALFALAGILFGYNKRAGVSFGIVSFIVCIARIAAGVHYPSDVLAGACIGIASAYAVQRIALRYTRS